MPDPYKLSVLTEVRKTAGITLAQMAYSFGLTGSKSRETVGAWERGQSVPRSYHRRHFIDYLANTLGLRSQLEKFQAIWDVLIAEWHWEPITENEWQEYFGAQERAVSGTTTAPSTAHMAAHPDAFSRYRKLLLHNLPSPTTSFIGRDREIHQISRLLQKARLVTLTGPGGSGKTRLAIQTAGYLTHAYADGVWFVDLTPINDPALTLATIAGVVGIKNEGDEPLVDRLVAYLRPRQILLLLDNFEQLLDAASDIAMLLKTAPQLTVLVTSRVILHLSGEHAFAVPPLALPDPQASFGRILQNAAVSLFVDRSRAVQTDFVLTSDNVVAIVEICTRLDGLPLAIELAAARSRQFTPQDMVSHFLTALDLGSDGPIDVPHRHQALRRMMAWSYRLLSPEEQTLFVRLAVFVGGWSAEAVVAVCLRSESEQYAMRLALDALVARNLVQQQPAIGDEPRFRMLETIREYATEKFVVRREYAEVREAHARYYLSFAEATAREFAGPQQSIWMERLDQDYANLRAAIQWSLEHGHEQILLRLCIALRWFWHRRAYTGEGRYYFEHALKHMHTATASLRAAGFAAAGHLAHTQNDYPGASRLFSNSLDLYRELADQHGIAQALSNLGEVAMAQRDFSRASVLLIESLALFRELENNQGVALTLLRLAWTTLFTLSFEQAGEYVTESLALWQELEYPSESASAYTILGLLSFLQEDYQTASSLFNTAFQLYQMAGDTVGISTVLMQQGYTALFQGNYMQAAPLFQESLVLQLEIKERLVIAYCLDGLAGIAGLKKQPARAARLGGAAEGLRQGMHITLNPADRAHYQRIWIVTRSQLDDASWSAAWAEGQALPLEQAIGYALASDDRDE